MLPTSRSAPHPRLVSPVSSEALIEEREALNALLQSDGWKYFKAKVLTEMQGEGYWQRMGTAVQDPTGVAAKVQHLTSIEVLNMLNYPANRVLELKGQVE